MGDNREYSHTPDSSDIEAQIPLPSPSLSPSLPPMNPQQHTLPNGSTRAAPTVPNQADHRHTEGTPGPGSTAFLDGLRGLAALFVLVQHYIGAFDFNVHEHGFGEKGEHYYLASLPFLRIVFSGGSAAVAVFFVLSGYVLAKSPLRLLRGGKRRECGAALASAVARRPLRLYAPTLAVALGVAVAMHLPWLLREMGFPKPQPSLAAELWNWAVQSVKYFNPFRTHGSSQMWYPYSLVAWTIPIELKGSMLVYGLLAVYAFSGVSLGVSLAVLAASVPVLLQLGQWTMACFIAGLILAMVDGQGLDAVLFDKTWHLAPGAQQVIRHASFVVGYYLLCQPAHAGDASYSADTPGWRTLTYLTPAAYDKNQYYRYWHSWGAVLLVYATLRLPWLQSFLNGKPLRYLGKVSFMFYLIHLPVLYALGGRVGRMFGNVYGTDPTWWDDKLWLPDFGPAGMNTRFLASLAVILPVCLVAADFLTRWLDEPSVQLGKRLVQRLGLENGGGKGLHAGREGGGLPLHAAQQPEMAMRDRSR